MFRVPLLVHLIRRFAYRREAQSQSSKKVGQPLAWHHTYFFQAAWVQHVDRVLRRCT